MPELFTGENKNKKVLVFGHGLLFNALTCESKRDETSVLGSCYVNKLNFGETELAACYVDENGKFEFCNSTRQD